MVLQAWSCPCRCGRPPRTRRNPASGRRPAMRAVAVIDVRPRTSRAGARRTHSWPAPDRVLDLGVGFDLVRQALAKTRPLCIIVTLSTTRSDIHVVLDDDVTDMGATTSGFRSVRAARWGKPCGRFVEQDEARGAGGARVSSCRCWPCASSATNWSLTGVRCTAWISASVACISASFAPGRSGEIVRAKRRGRRITLSRTVRPGNNADIW